VEPRETADGSLTLYSARYGEAMHSAFGAVSEARWVFLQGSGVAARLSKRQATRVLEVGFGTGLNFFLTADEARRKRARLDYTALEHTLVDADTVRTLGYDRHLSTDVLEDYLSAREALPPQPETGRYALEIVPGVTLTLVLGDARGAAWEGHFHAVYHDAFSPEANPELWDVAFLSRLAEALEPAGKLASYCVKGEVRRRLQALGLETAKRPGPPGGKREVLVATRPDADG
jgi:tRNA U34 5-methylaminomethyl-2-thiouridine-forming methyltransferase MnmC